MKVKHIEILECVESRTLFKILGRHRAIREINKGKLSCMPRREKDGTRSVMENVAWTSSVNTTLWARVYRWQQEGHSPAVLCSRKKSKTLRKYLRIQLVRAATCV